MRRARLMLWSLAVLALIGASQSQGHSLAGADAGADDAQLRYPGVANMQRARVNYMLQCQGCHSASGDSPDAMTPPMKHMVARFLTVEGGRAYLGRVPGVATAVLDDAQLAELLNWTIYHFDAGHVPDDFQPYDAAEIGALRAKPLRADAPAMRKALVEKIEQKTEMNN